MFLIGELILAEYHQRVVDKLIGTFTRDDILAVHTLALELVEVDNPSALLRASDGFDAVHLVVAPGGASM